MPRQPQQSLTATEDRGQQSLGDDSFGSQQFSQQVLSPDRSNVPSQLQRSSIPEIPSSVQQMPFFRSQKRTKTATIGLTSVESFASSANNLEDSEVHHRDSQPFNEQSVGFESKQGSYLIDDPSFQDNTFGGADTSRMSFLQSPTALSQYKRDSNSSMHLNNIFEKQQKQSFQNTQSKNTDYQYGQSQQQQTQSQHQQEHGHRNSSARSSRSKPTALKRSSDPKQTIKQFRITEELPKRSEHPNLTPEEYDRLRKSMSIISNVDIEIALKKLRSFTAVKEVKTLSNPSMISTRCIDEDEVVKNIRGIAKELNKISTFRRDLSSQVESRLEEMETELAKKARTKTRSIGVFEKLYQDSFKKKDKHQEMIIADVEAIEQKSNKRRLNPESQKILDETKFNYVPIQERARQIVLDKEQRIQEARQEKELKELQEIKPFPVMPSQQNQQQQHQHQHHQYMQNSNNRDSSSKMHAQGSRSPTIRMDSSPKAYNGGQITHKLSQKRLLEFFERNKSKQESTRDLIEKQKNMKSKGEMSEVTFKPKINPKSEILLSNKSWVPIDLRWQQIQDAAEEKKRINSIMELSLTPFSPLINKNSQAIVLQKNRSTHLLSQQSPKFNGASPSARTTPTTAAAAVQNRRNPAKNENSPNENRKKNSNNQKENPQNQVPLQQQKQFTNNAINGNSRQASIQHAPTFSPVTKKPIRQYPQDTNRTGPSADTSIQLQARRAPKDTLNLTFLEEANDLNQRPISKSNSMIFTNAHKTQTPRDKMANASMNDSVVSSSHQQVPQKQLKRVHSTSQYGQKTKQIAPIYEIVPDSFEAPLNIVPKTRENAFIYNILGISQ